MRFCAQGLPPIVRGNHAARVHRLAGQDHLPGIEALGPVNHSLIIHVKEPVPIIVILQPRHGARDGLVRPDLDAGLPPSLPLSPI
jgi:hypothetical protein